jgi:hypothetical protein
VDTSTHHLSAFGHHVTIGTGFPIYEGGEEGLLPSVNILRFHCSTLASTIQTTFTKVSTDLIPAVPLWLRDNKEIGLCFFHISMSGHALDFVVIGGAGPGGRRGAAVGKGGAGGVIHIVVTVVADMSWGSVVDGVGDGPGISSVRSIEVPVDSR